MADDPQVNTYSPAQFYGKFYIASGALQRAQAQFDKATADGAPPDVLAEIQQEVAKRQAAAEQAHHEGTAAYIKFTGHLQGLDDPTSGMSAVDKLRAGIASGGKNAALHVANLVPGVDLKDRIAENEARDAPLGNTGAGFIGQALGANAALAPLGMGTAAALGKLGTAAPMLGGLTRLVQNPLGRAAVEGEAQGQAMLDPNANASDRLTTGIAAPILGAAIPAAGRAAGAALTGQPGNAAARLLLERNVPLTPAQAFPGNELLQYAEQLPLGRQIAEPARAAARNEGFRAIVQSAVAKLPGVQVTGATPREMLGNASDAFDSLYGAAKGFPVSPTIVGTGSNTTTALSKAFSQATTRGLTKENASVADQELQELLKDHLALVKGQRRPLDSADLIQLRSQIRKMENDASLGDDAVSVGRTKVFDRAEHAVTDALRSQLPPSAMQSLDLADSQYGNFKTLIQAGLRNAKNGTADILGPTPRDINAQIARQRGANAFVTGKGIQGAQPGSSADMQALSEALAQVGHEQPGMRTGHGILAGGLLAPVTVPLAAAARFGPARRLLTGQTALQKAARAAALPGAPNAARLQALKRAAAGLLTATRPGQVAAGMGALGTGPVGQGFDPANEPEAQ